MGDWIHTTDINGNKGWLNIKTNQFKTTAPSQGTIQQNTARYLGYRPNVKADRIKAAVKMAKSYNSRQYQPHNHSDETIKLKQKHQEVIIDKKGEPRIIQADFTPRDEAPMKITGPEKLLVETVAVPVTPVKFGVAALAGKFGSGALQRWGRNTILEDAFKNVVDKGLTNTAESQAVKQTAKEVIPKYNEVRYISINTPKQVKDVVNNFTSKVNGLKNLKNQSLKKSNTKEAIDYDAFLSELADKESALDQINSKLSQESKWAASKYVQTGHAKPLTQSQQNTIAHKVGSDFTGQYIIEPSGLQKAFGKVQINKIKNLGGKTEGVDSLLPVEIGQTTTLYSPKTFILENSNKPSLFGFYPEQDLGRPRNVAGMYYTKYDLSTADPALTPKSPLYTLIHERNSHGTDNLMSKLKVALRWKGDINKNPIHTVQEHYQKLINDIVANNPELNLDGSKLWYELRATNNEVTARAYQKVFKDAKKAGKIPQDASINDKGVIESLKPAYEQEIDKLTPESLAKIYASVNGYGEDYAKAIQNAIEKAQSTNNTEELNTFIDNLKSGIKYLPAVIPVGIGLNQNQYKNGGKMKIYFAKKGIHIKKQNEGKFTEYCGGKVTQNCINRAKASGDSKLVKRAIFAENAKHWKHKNGGKLTEKYAGGGKVAHDAKYNHVTQIYQSYVNHGVNPQTALELTNQKIAEKGWTGWVSGDNKRYNNVNSFTDHTIDQFSRLYPDSLKSNNFNQFFQGIEGGRTKYNPTPNIYRQHLLLTRPGVKKRINEYRRLQGQSPLALVSPTETSQEQNLLYNPQLPIENSIIVTDYKS